MKGASFFSYFLLPHFDILFHAPSFRPSYIIIIIPHSLTLIHPSITQVITDGITGRSKGYGFVRFGGELERDRALDEMNGHFLSNRPIRVSLATARKNAPAMTAMTAMQAPHPSDFDPTNTTLFIGGLSSQVNEDQLRALFGQFGDIIYVKIPAGKGCGFVQFVLRTSAERAMNAMNASILGNSAIRISWGRSSSRAANHAAQLASLAGIPAAAAAVAFPGAFGDPALLAAAGAYRGGGGGGGGQFNGNPNGLLPGDPYAAFVGGQPPPDMFVGGGGGGGGGIPYAMHAAMVGGGGGGGGGGFDGMQQVLHGGGGGGGHMMGGPPPPQFQQHQMMAAAAAAAAAAANGNGNGMMTMPPPQHHHHHHPQQYQLRALPVTAAPTGIEQQQIGGVVQEVNRSGSGVTTTDGGGGGAGTISAPSSAAGSDGVAAATAAVIDTVVVAVEPQTAAKSSSQPTTKSALANGSGSSNGGGAPVTAAAVKSTMPLVGTHLLASLLF